MWTTLVLHSTSLQLNHLRAEYVQITESNPERVKVLFKPIRFSNRKCVAVSWLVCGNLQVSSNLREDDLCGWPLWLIYWTPLNSGYACCVLKSQAIVMRLPLKAWLFFIITVIDWKHTCGAEREGGRELTILFIINLIKASSDPNEPIFRILGCFWCNVFPAGPSVKFWFTETNVRRQLSLKPGSLLLKRNLQTFSKRIQTCPAGLLDHGIIYYTTCRGLDYVL